MNVDYSSNWQFYTILKFRYL